MLDIYKSIAIFLAVITMMSCTPAKTKIPKGAFPLEQSTIETAIKDIGATWTTELRTDGVKSFYIYDKDGGTLAIIPNEKPSADMEDIETLSMTCFPPDFKGNIIQKITFSLKGDDIKSAIQLATRLYGGFENDTEVYDAFMKDYNDNTNISVKEVIDDNLDSKYTTWGKEISDILCFITVEEKASGKSEYYLRNVTFYNKLPDNEVFDRFRELLQQK